MANSDEKLLGSYIEATYTFVVEWQLDRKRSQCSFVKILLYNTEAMGSNLALGIDYSFLKLFLARKSSRRENCVRIYKKFMQNNANYFFFQKSFEIW